MKKKQIERETCASMFFFILLLQKKSFTSIHNDFRIALDSEYYAQPIRKSRSFLHNENKQIKKKKKIVSD